MTYCIAVFRSRSQAIDCKNALARAGIWAEITATPAALRLGCGLSVRFRYSSKRGEKISCCHAVYRAFYRDITGRKKIGGAGVAKNSCAAPAAVLKYRHERKRNSVRT